MEHQPSYGTLQPRQGPQADAESIEHLMDSNPVAVFRALKDVQALGAPKLPFIACKQQQLVEYSMQVGETKSNMAKYIQKDPHNRIHHRSEDVSINVTPYKNRLPVGETYRSAMGYKAVHQVQSNMRN